MVFTNEVYQTTIQIFLKNFENKLGGLITRYELEDDFLPPASNFTSLIIRIKIEYNKNNKIHEERILVKIPGLCSRYEIISATTNLYKKELYMYNVILKKFYEYWEHDFLTPLSYPIVDTEILFMQDLTSIGYKTIGKLDRLDLQHCKIVFVTLAKYHALSVKYRENHGMGDNMLIDRILPIDSTVVDYHKYNFKKFLDTVIYLNENDVYDKLKDCDYLAATLYQEELDRNEFNVLLHGDLWSANCMFQYDDRNCPQKMKIVDLQFCHWGAPIIDIIFLFVTSVKFEVFDQSRNFLIQLYLEQLNTTLNELNCQSRYTENEMRQSMRKHKLHWVSLIGTVLANSLSELPALLDKTMDIHSSQLYKTELSKWVDFLRNEVL